MMWSSTAACAPPECLRLRSWTNPTVLSSWFDLCHATHRSATTLLSTECKRSTRSLVVRFQTPSSTPLAALPRPTSKRLCSTRSWTNGTKPLILNTAIQRLTGTQRQAGGAGYDQIHTQRNEADRTSTGPFARQIYRGRAYESGCGTIRTWNRPAGISRRAAASLMRF